MKLNFPQDFKSEQGVWVSPETDILTDYSDGIASERFLSKTLDEVADLSSSSLELKQHAKDWTSAYHLTPERSTLLRALDWNQPKRVLELGAGCGALTAFLCEHAERVTAVEGSLARCELIAKRCRDHQNLDIVAGAFQHIEWEEKFDVITLIGVLEYAALYSQSETPYASLLDYARRQLQPNGILIVAIENQLGVKYLAGCGEDHGHPVFSGIEGYPTQSGAKTFSRNTLREMLRDCGLEHQRWLLPFPDYKLPSALLNAQYCGAKSANRWQVTQWCRQTYDQYDGERQHLFCDHLALDSFAEAGLLSDVSNSFLALASPTDWSEQHPVSEPNWIARKINAARSPAFRTQVTLYPEDGGTIQKLFTDPNTDREPFKFVPHATAPFVDSSGTLATLMLRSLRRADAPVNAFNLCLDAWREFLVRASEADDPPFRCVAGRLFDCTPYNLLVHGEEGLTFIDDEWHWKRPVPLAQVLYRGLTQLWMLHEPWIRKAFGGDARSQQQFLKTAYAHLQIEITRGDLRDFAEEEEAFQARVSGWRPPAPQAPLPVEDQWERTAHILSHSAAIDSVVTFGDAAKRWFDSLGAFGFQVHHAGSAPFTAPSTEHFDLAIIDPVSCPQLAQLPLAQFTEFLLLDPDDDGILASTTRELRAAGYERVELDREFGQPHAGLYRQSGTKRVTLVTPTSDLHGGTLVLWKHAELLAQAGHRVTMASFDEAYPSWAPYHPSIKFRPVSSGYATFDSQLPGADAIVASLWSTAPDVARAPGHAGKKLYLVQHFESLWAGEPDEVDATYLDSRLEKLCVSSWLKECLESDLGVESSVVLNGCDFADDSTLRDAGQVRKGPLQVGMLYHTAKWKGLDDGFAAYRKVKAELGDRVQLNLYGTKRPEPLPPECDAFLENPSRDQLRDFLDQLDVFVSPSHCEGFGLPALEAMCRGVATVLTDCGGCRDYAIKEAVLLSPPRDSEKLGENLLKVLREPALRAELEQNGLEVGRNFSWRHSVESLNQSIQQATDRPVDPLKILYVGAGPRWFETFMDPWLVSALKGLGHEVIEFHPRPEDARYTKEFVQPELLDAVRRADFLAGRGELPSSLPRVAKRTRPDLVFFNKGLLIPEHVLNRLRDMGIPTAAWMMDEPQEFAFSSARGRLFDYVFVQDAGSLQRHRESGNPNTFLFAHGLDPVVHASRFLDPDAPHSRACDLLLIGTGFPARRAQVQKLAELDAEVLVVGRGWEGMDRSGIQVINEPVSADDAAALYRSAKMTLNLHRGGADMAVGGEVIHPLTPNGSFFHATGCGSLQIVDRGYPGADQYLVPDQHYVTFGSDDELRERIQFLLENPAVRESMSRAGSLAIHKSHSYRDHLGAALQQIGRPTPQPRHYGLSTSSRADRSVLDLEASAPRLSTIVLVEDVKRLQPSLLGITRATSIPSQLLLAHGPNDEIGRWLDQRGLLHVTGSTDDQAELVHAAFSRCEGDLIAIAQDRAFPSAHSLRRMIALFDANPRLGALGPGVEPTATEQRIDLRYNSLDELDRTARALYLKHRDHLEEVETLDPAMFVVRREVLEDVGHFAQRGTLDGSIDDWCRRVRDCGWQVAWTSRALVHNLAPSTECIRRSKTRRDEQVAASELTQFVS